MRDYLKNNDVNSIMRDRMSVLLEGVLDEELNGEGRIVKRVSCYNKVVTGVANKIY